MSTFINDIAAQVEIPEEGTLSRVLCKDGAVRLVAFGFDTGEELTEHTSASTAIVQVISGAITVDVGGQSHRLNPTAWLLMEPHAPHSLRALEPSVVILTLVRGPG